MLARVNNLLRVNDGIFLSKLHLLLQRLIQSLAFKNTNTALRL
ncbi:hypothetical protein L810_8324 [Burkholderia sp. AU4i]|nr:hypothetical protein L810_8324 [Burkholderia sp. AU4i]MDW9233576.1 hypothetical protein [Burkholderia cepacia]